MSHIIMTPTDWGTLISFIVVVIIVTYFMYLMYGCDKDNWFQKWVKTPHSRVLTPKQITHWKSFILISGFVMTGLWIAAVSIFFATRMTPQRLAHNQKIERQMTQLNVPIQNTRQQLEFNQIMQHKTTNPKQLHYYLDQQLVNQQRLRVLLAQKKRLNQRIYRPEGGE